MKKRPGMAHFLKKVTNIKLFLVLARRLESQQMDIFHIYLL